MPGEGSSTGYGHPVTGMLIGYARCSTDTQDLTAQRNALTALGVTPDRLYTDHGLTGTSRARPGLREALAACRITRQVPVPGATIRAMPGDLRRPARGPVFGGPSGAGGRASRLGSGGLGCAETPGLCRAALPQTPLGWLHFLPLDQPRNPGWRQGLRAGLL